VIVCGSWKTKRENEVFQISISGFTVFF